MNVRFEQPFEDHPTRGGVSTYAPFSDQWILSEDIFSPNWFVEDASVTPKVPVGGVVDAEVTITNERSVIFPGETDICRDGFSSGLGADITVSPDWTEADDRFSCVGIGEFGLPSETYTFDFPAPPTVGTHSVEITVEGHESGRGGTESFEVVAVEPGTIDPRPGPGNGDEDESGVIDVLLSALGLEGGGAAGNTPLVVLVVVLLLLVVVSVGS